MFDDGLQELLILIIKLEFTFINIIKQFSFVVFVRQNHAIFEQVNILFHSVMQISIKSTNKLDILKISLTPPNWNQLSWCPLYSCSHDSYFSKITLYYKNYYNHFSLLYHLYHHYIFDSFVTLAFFQNIFSLFSAFLSFYRRMMINLISYLNLMKIF